MRFFCGELPESFTLFFANQRGADIRSAVSETWTPLTAAIAGGFEGMVPIILKHIAATGSASGSLLVNECDFYGRFPLNVAVTSNKRDLVG